MRPSVVIIVAAPIAILTIRNSLNRNLGDGVVWRTQKVANDQCSCVQHVVTKALSGWGFAPL